MAPCIKWSEPDNHFAVFLVNVCRHVIRGVYKNRKKQNGKKRTYYFFYRDHLLPFSNIPSQKTFKSSFSDTDVIIRGGARNTGKTFIKNLP